MTRHGDYQKVEATGFDARRDQGNGTPIELSEWFHFHADASWKDCMLGETRDPPVNRMLDRLQETIKGRVVRIENEASKKSQPAPTMEMKQRAED